MRDPDRSLRATEKPTKTSTISGPFPTQCGRARRPPRPLGNHPIGAEQTTTTSERRDRIYAFVPTWKSGNFLLILECFFPKKPLGKVEEAEKIPRKLQISVACRVRMCLDDHGTATAPEMKDQTQNGKLTIIRKGVPQHFAGSLNVSDRLQKKKRADSKRRKKDAEPFMRNHTNTVD